MKKFILIVMAGLILVACGPKRPNFQEVSSPPKQLIQKGFSLTPLNELGWYIIGRSPYAIALAKQGSSPDETYAIQGSVYNIGSFSSDNEFIHFINKGQAQDTDISNPNRFKITAHDTTLKKYKGEPCAYSHTVTEDHAAVKRTNQNEFMVLEIFALVCRHPENQNAAISVNYSERYYPTNRSENIEAKAKILLNSLDFETL